MADAADDEGQHPFQSLTTDLQPFVCNHALLRFGSVGYNLSDGFRWDLAYVYDKVKSAGETKPKTKLLQDLTRLCNDIETLSDLDLHLKARRRLGGPKRHCSKCGNVGLV